MGRWCTPQSGTQETEAVRSLFKTSQGHIVSTGFKKKKKQEKEKGGGRGERRERKEEGKMEGGRGRKERERDTDLRTDPQG